jgi:spore maturation protein CgeB
MFMVLAGGGFLLTNHMEGMERFFEPGREFAVYRSPKEAVDQCEYFLHNEKEREAAAKFGQEKCLMLYTYKNRMQEIIDDHMRG